MGLTDEFTTGDEGGGKGSYGTSHKCLCSNEVGKVSVSIYSY